MFWVIPPYVDEVSLDLSLSQTLDIFKLLTLTYSRYVDTPSREAVETVGRELVKRDELRGMPDGEPDESPLGVTEQIIGWLVHEVGHISKLSKCVNPVITPAYASLIVAIALMLPPTCLFCLDGAAGSTTSAYPVTPTLPRSPRGALSSACWPP